MGIFKAFGWFVTGGLIRPTTTRERSRLYQRRANDLLSEQLDVMQQMNQHQVAPIDSRERGTCPACHEFMLIGASTCPFCHETGITWPGLSTQSPVTQSKKIAVDVRGPQSDNSFMRRSKVKAQERITISKQEIEANQRAHHERELISSFYDSQFLMSRYSDLMTREGLNTIDELRARLGQSLKKVSDEILDNDTATTVTFSRHRMTESKKRCNEAIGELRILVEAAMDSTRDVQVSELELRNSFDLARKTLESYSVMSNVGVQQYKETISRFAVDISVKFGYLYL